MSIGPIVRAMLRNKIRFGLIALEMALTLAIAVNCVTMIRRARADATQTSGMADDDLLFTPMLPFDPSFKEEARLDDVIDRDLEAMRKMPGVRAATETLILPWQGGGSSTEVRLPGGRGGYLRVQSYEADEATLDTLGLELVTGKGFSAADVQRGSAGLRRLRAEIRARNPDGTAKTPFLQEVVISEAFARLAFGAEPAIGKMLEDRDGDQFRVIGVVGRYYTPYAWNIGSYVMFNPSRFLGRVRYLVRAEPGRRDEVARALSSRLLSVAEGRNFHVQSIAELSSRYNANNNLVVRVLSLVLFLVVFVTFLGVVGVTSFSVTERTRQIGIRRAVGAQRLDVVLHFLLENAVVSGLGIGLGVAFAYGLNVVLVSRLGASRIEPTSIAVTLLLLAVGGQLAALAPALRGARVAPTIATRNV
jgi:putative ABC transport system permease protein